MFQQLVSHNADVRKLVEKGYAVAIDGGHMIVRDIPYLDRDGLPQWGAFVLKLVYIDQLHVTYDDHQIYFAGSAPHNLDGLPVPNLGGGPHTLTLGETSADVVVQRSFSNKPRETGKFVDLFDKVESYAALIAGPAMHRHGVTPYTFRVPKETQQGSIFKFQDTLTSRAEITELSRLFHSDVVAVIGLGGTGSYVLDFMVKSPVKEVRGFDVDRFHVHNAFRSPGCLRESELGLPKAEVYQSRYQNFRHGLLCQPKSLDATSVDDLEGVTFAFVCVDKGSSRSQIFDLLIAKGISFIDVGMGLSRQDDRGPIKGMLRGTLFSGTDSSRIRGLDLAPTSDAPDDIYRTNIQISELNALNAALAVTRFKQLRGFYIEGIAYYNLLFDLFDLKIVGTSRTDENSS